MTTIDLLNSQADAEAKAKWEADTKRLFEKMVGLLTEVRELLKNPPKK